jgi:uncharacterized protein YtpQ (UPF0354 family)
MKLLFWKGRMSKAQFRDRFVEAIRQRYPQARIEVKGELDLEVEGLGGDSRHVLWLGRAFQEFEQDPKSIDSIFTRWLGSFPQAEEAVSLEERLASLVPMIKDHAWLRGQQESSASLGAPFDLWVEDYNSELVIAYAEFRSSIRFVRNSTADSLGVPKSELREIAVRNLTERTRGRTIIGEDGLYLVGAGGNLEASLLLNEEVWRDARLQIRGDAVVGVPDRDSFIVTGDADAGQLFEASAMVCRLHRTERYGVSGKLFQRRDGRFEPVDNAQEDENHPVRSLEVIDVYAKKNSGGATLAVVIASPLQVDARSIYRLYRKLDGYLDFIASEGFAQECGTPSPESTDIDVNLHVGSDPAISALLGSLDGWAKKRFASLRITPLEV